MQEVLKSQSTQMQLLFSKEDNANVLKPLSLTRFNVQSLNNQKEQSDGDTSATLKQLNMRFKAESTYFGEAKEEAKAGTQKSIEKVAYGVDVNA